MHKLSIKDLPLRDKRLFVRVDFNVPLSEEGRVTDDTRIRETLPTLEYAIRNRAKLILASHLGRPKGKPNAKMSLKPVAERLRMLLDNLLESSCNVGFSPDCVGIEAEELSTRLESGQTLLLENLRDAVLQGLRRGARVGCVDVDLWRRNVGVLSDRQLRDRRDADQHDDDRDHPCKDGSIDEYA